MQYPMMACNHKKYKHHVQLKVTDTGENNLVEIQVGDHKRYHFLE